MNDNENKNDGAAAAAEKKGILKKFSSLNLTKKFLIILAGVLVLFAIATIILAIIEANHGFGYDKYGVPNPMNWYGYIIGMAIVICVVVGQYASMRQGYYTDLVFDYVIFAVPCAFGGGVLYYFLFNIEDVIRSGNMGIAVLGALIGALIGLILAKLFYRHVLKDKPNVKIIQMLDLAAVFILLGQAIGRIGCYFGHCCYGIKVDFDFFPFSYVVNNALHLGNPFIESIWCALGFIPMVIMYLSSRKSFNGFYISLYCIWYGIERFILEFFRDPAQKLNAAGGFGEGFGISQVVSLLMIAFGIVWILQYVIRAKRAGKKVMILVPKDRLSDEYFEYGKTVYAHPQADGEGRSLLGPAPVAAAAVDGENGTGNEGK